MRLKPSSSPEVLNLFALVAEQGSIAAAARQLDMPASLATRKVAQLEDALNARLFERTTRSIKLTVAGEMALAWARQSLESREQLIDRLAELQGSPSGLIRLAVMHYSAIAFLPHLLGRFCDRYPQIRVSIATTDAAVNLVEQQFDLAIQSGRIADSSVVGQRVRQYQRVLCATPDYLSRHGMPVKPSDLTHHRCLAHTTNEARNWFFRRGRRLVSQPIVPTIEADNYAVLLELTRQSLGIARLGRPLVEADLKAGAIVPLIPQYACVYADGEAPDLWVTYPNRHVLGRTRLLIDFLVQNLSEVLG